MSHKKLNTTPMSLSLESVIQCFPGVVFWQDLDFVIHGCNHAAARLFGFKSTKKMEGKTPLDFPCKASESAPDFMKLDTRAIETEKIVTSIIVDTFADHQMMPHLVKKSPIFENEAVVGVLIQGFQLDTKGYLANVGAYLAQLDSKRHSGTEFCYLLDNQVNDFNLSEREIECLFYFIRGKTILSNDYNDEQPHAHLMTSTSTQSKIPAHGGYYNYGQNFKNQAAFQQQRVKCSVETHWRHLHPNDILLIQNTLGETKPYRILKIDFSGNQKKTENKIQRYQSTLHLTAVNTKAHPNLSQYSHNLNAIQFAFIEANDSSQPLLDTEGRYQIRLMHAQGSAPIRRMQAYTGAQFGMHFPLHGGTEVAVGFLNADPNRPVIYGMLPNFLSPSPVTCSNFEDNILRSWGQQSIHLSDTPYKQFIQLETHDAQQVLRLDARREQHEVKLTTKLGSLKISAANHLSQNCGAELTLQIGSMHRICIQQNLKIISRKGSIHYSAAKNIKFSANKAIHLQSAQKDISLRATHKLNLSAKNQLKFTINSGSLKIQTREGNLHVHAGRTLTLKSLSGQIILKQAGSSIIFSKTGDISFYAPLIQIGAVPIESSS